MEKVHKTDFFFHLAKQVTLANQPVYLFLKGRGYCRAHCFSSYDAWEVQILSLTNKKKTQSKDKIIHFLNF